MTEEEFDEFMNRPEEKIWSIEIFDGGLRLDFACGQGKSLLDETRERLHKMYPGRVLKSNVGYSTGALEEAMNP